MKKRLFRILSLFLVLLLIVGCSNTKVFEEKDLGVAVMNRLNKAAGYKLVNV